MFGLHKRKYKVTILLSIYLSIYLSNYLSIVLSNLIHKLPENLDESSAQCEFTDGILKIVIKKIGEQGVARKLQIK
jgi:hypothetical protein